MEDSLSPQEAEAVGVERLSLHRLVAGVTQAPQRANEILRGGAREGQDENSLRRNPFLKKPSYPANQGECLAGPRAGQCAQDSLLGGSKFTGRTTEALGARLNSDAPLVCGR